MLIVTAIRHFPQYEKRRCQSVWDALARLTESSLWGRHSS